MPILWLVNTAINLRREKKIVMNNVKENKSCEALKEGVVLL